MNDDKRSVVTEVTNVTTLIVTITLAIVGAHYLAGPIGLVVAGMSIILITNYQPKDE